jgi:hypothetical protein
VPITDKTGTPKRPARFGAPSPADVRGVADQLRLFLILLIGLIVVSQLELPFRLAGILLGLATGWSGIRLLVRMNRLRRIGGRPRGPVLVSAGLGLSAVLLLMLLAEAAYYPMASDLERCRSGANTQTAQKACEDAARDRIDRLVNRINNAR